MPKTVTPFEVHAWLEENLRARADLGFRKAVERIVFESPSPFDPQARRKPKTGFLMLMSPVAAATSCFLYFNLGS
jgi:hypothetical protein